MPLQNASYEGWVFPYAMAQLHGTGTIAAIYNQTEQQPDVLHAIDAGVPGGLRQAWPEFALAAWNQDPVEPDFEGWDHFSQHPEEDGHEILTQQVDVGPDGQFVVDEPLGLPPLTRAYRHVTFGPSVTQITVDKPSFPSVNVQALLKLRDGTETTEDWSGKQPVYCPRDPAKRVAEAVLVVSNSSLDTPSPSGPDNDMRVVATNTGCSRYTGEASGSYSVRGGDTDMEESWSASGLVYDRYLDQQTVVPRFLFRLTGGSVSWSLSGTQDGCAVHAGPITLPVPANGFSGQLDIHSIVVHGAAGAAASRGYLANGYGLPSVQGTETCGSSPPFTRYFSPHTFLQTNKAVNDLKPFAPDGTLQGTNTYTVSAGETASYRWRLVPDR
jgi:hypothetical protein